MLDRTAAATSVPALAGGCAGQGSEPWSSEQVQHSADQPISGPSTAAQAPSQLPPSAEQTIWARISDGNVEDVPAQVEVDRGTRIRIEVTSDGSGELQLVRG